MVGLAAVHHVRVAHAPDHQRGGGHRDGLQHHLDDRVVRGRGDLRGGTRGRPSTCSMPSLALQLARGSPRGARCPLASARVRGVARGRRGLQHAGVPPTARCAVTPRRRMAMPPWRCASGVVAGAHERAARPGSVSMSPSSASVRSASRMSGRPTPNRVASSRSEGSLSPGRRLARQDLLGDRAGPRCRRSARSMPRPSCG